MYEVVKRIGSFCEELPEAPVFADRDEAVRWASEFLQEHPDEFSPGLEAIEVRPRRA